MTSNTESVSGLNIRGATVRAGTRPQEFILTRPIAAPHR